MRPDLEPWELPAQRTVSFFCHSRAPPHLILSVCLRPRPVLCGEGGTPSARCQKHHVDGGLARVRGGSGERGSVSGVLSSGLGTAPRRAGGWEECRSGTAAGNTDVTLLWGCRESPGTQGCAASSQISRVHTRQGCTIWEDQGAQVPGDSRHFITPCWAPPSLRSVLVSGTTVTQQMAATVEARVALKSRSRVLPACLTWEHSYFD